MAKITESAAFIILVAFAFLGAIVAGIIFHEYSHAYDFKGLVQNEKICGLVLPAKLSDITSGEGGYYSFSVDKDSSNSEKIQNIDKYTELKAYSVTILVLSIFMACVSIVSKRALSNDKRQIYCAFDSDKMRRETDIEFVKRKIETYN